MVDENDLSDEELEKLEQEQQSSKITDKYDLLEELRVLLNSSKVEQMKYFHTHSSHGRNCSYYKKSKELFERQEKQKVLSLLRQVQEKFNDK